MFLSFLWNKSCYLDLCSHIVVWSSMTSACRFVPRHLWKSAVALSDFLRSWLVFLGNEGVNVFLPVRWVPSAEPEVCRVWVCVSGCVQYPGVPPQRWLGQIFSWRAGFKNILEPDVGLSTEVKQLTNGIMTCDKSKHPFNLTSLWLWFSLMVIKSG